MEPVSILIILLVSLTPTVFHYPRAVVTTEQDASWWTVSAGPTFAGNLKIKIQIQTRFRSSGHHTEGLTVRVLFWSGWKSSSCQQSVSSRGGGRCPSQRSPGQSAAAALGLGLSTTCCSYFCFKILAAAKTVTLSAAVFVNQIPPRRSAGGRWSLTWPVLCCPWAARLEECSVTALSGGTSWSCTAETDTGLQWTENFFVVCRMTSRE